MPESSTLNFHCRLLAPYHTTQHTHRNLLRCAPHVFGSSIRGVILSHLIQTNCRESYLAELATKKTPVEIQKFHRSCSEECLLRDIAGETDWLPVFSFGEFQTDFARGLHHRVAIDRERRTVAAGKIVSIEAVPEGTNFQFSVTLPVPALKHRQQLEQAVRQVGQWMGLGHYKSVGLGRFEIIAVEVTTLSTELARTQASLDNLGTTFRLRVLTHLVLHAGNKRLPLEGRALAEALVAALAHRASEITKRFDLGRMVPLATVPNTCRISFRPDYVSRISFEEGTRKNALVALPESWLDVSVDEVNGGLVEQLAIAEVLGVGPWADAGFGRLKAEAVGGGDGQAL